MKTCKTLESRWWILNLDLEATNYMQNHAFFIILKQHIHILNVYHETMMKLLKTFNKPCEVFSSKPIYKLPLPCWISLTLTVIRNIAPFTLHLSRWTYKLSGSLMLKVTSFCKSWNCRELQQPLESSQHFEHLESSHAQSEISLKETCTKQRRFHDKPMRRTKDCWKSIGFEVGMIHKTRSQTLDLRLLSENLLKMTKCML
jgi:hypothetical protein